MRPDSSNRHIYGDGRTRNAQRNASARARSDYGRQLRNIQRPQPPSSLPSAGAPRPPHGGATGGIQAGVQTSFNADDQAINHGSIMDRLGKEGGMVSAQLEGDGGRALADFANSQTMANAATVGRGLEQQNAQQNMKEQGMQSELLQTSMANQAKMFSDRAQNRVSQIGLASQLQNDLLRHSLMRK